MGFISKGEDIIVQPGGSSTESRSYFYRREKQDGTFEDVAWGTQAVDFDTPIVSSTWASYDSYKYIALGVTSKTYNEVYRFNRNSRVDTNIKVSNDVLPLNGTYNIDYITAVIPASQSASIETLAPYIIDEYYSGEYSNVIAIGKLYQNIPDDIPVNIDVNDVKEYKGTAESVQDYNLPTTEALYMVNLAVITNAQMEQLTSLSINLYRQEFIEFLGDNTITPGTVGKTQINPSYLPENAINNKIIVITEEMLVDDGNSEYIVVITPDYLTEFNNLSVYYVKFDMNTVPTLSGVSLGYYDLSSEEYVPVGQPIAVTVSGTIADTISYMILDGTFTIKAIL